METKALNFFSCLDEEILFGPVFSNLSSKELCRLRLVDKSVKRSVEAYLERVKPLKELLPAVDKEEDDLLKLVHDLKEAVQKRKERRTTLKEEVELIRSRVFFSFFGKNSLSFNAGYWNRSYSRLIGLPKEIEKMQSLRLLSLAGNCLTALPKELCTLKSLSCLWLAKNRIKRLPEEIINLTNLRLLDLESNEISSLPKGFGTLPSLYDLDLSNNLFTELPKEVYGLKALSTLKISRGVSYSEEEAELMGNLKIWRQR